MNRCAFCEWIPILPWPVWPLAGQFRLGQNVVVGSMTLLLAVRGNIATRSMSGPPFALQLHRTTVWCGATAGIEPPQYHRLEDTEHDRGKLRTPETAGAIIVLAADDWGPQGPFRSVIVQRHFGTRQEDGEPIPMVVEALEDGALRLVEITLLPRHRTAILHLTYVRGQIVLPGDKGRGLAIEGHGRVPHGQPRSVEVVERPDVLNPLPHPGGELRPTARRVEKIPADMGPTIGQDELVMPLGEGFIGAVPVTDQDHLHQIGVELRKMGFGHSGPPTWGDVEEDHRWGAGDPQIPAMPHLAGQLGKNVPPRFVAIEQLLAHLALPQRPHNRFKEGRDLPQPLGHRALGEGDAMMLQCLTEASRGTAIEVFVQQD